MALYSLEEKIQTPPPIVAFEAPQSLVPPLSPSPSLWRHCTPSSTGGFSFHSRQRRDLAPVAASPGLQDHPVRHPRPPPPSPTRFPSAPRAQPCAFSARTGPGAEGGRSQATPELSGQRGWEGSPTPKTDTITEGCSAGDRCEHLHPLGRPRGSPRSSARRGANPSQEPSPGPPHSPHTWGRHRAALGSSRRFRFLGLPRPRIH